MEVEVHVLALAQQESGYSQPELWKCKITKDLSSLFHGLVNIGSGGYIIVQLFNELVSQ